VSADLAGKNRGAIRRDIDLSILLNRIHYPPKVLEAGDGFNLAVREA
jgi:hypothetical protein